jgi:protein-tyrosine phosphatase
MGLFSIFSRKEKHKGPPADLSVLGCDIHSHFIPGIDDGAQTMEDSILLLSSMAEFGYRKVITTPHIMSDYFRNTPEIIGHGLEELKITLRSTDINLEIEAAAEYYFDSEFSAKIAGRELLTFGNNYVLFELSYLNAPEGLHEVIFQLKTNGYTPVLAHPERYPFWYANPEKYAEIKAKGALLQMNINSLTGFYSPAAKKIAEWLIDHNLIDFLGTDCHHQGHIKLMRKVVHETYLKKLIDSGRLLNSGLM